MVDRLAHAARVYRILLLSRVRSLWQYRASFFVSIAASFFGTFVDFVVVLVLFHQVPALAGWSFLEVAYLYGVSGTTFALVDLALGQIEKVHLMIQDGRFDSVLLRPAGTLVQLAASEFVISPLGKVVQAATVLVVAMSQLAIDWTPGRAAVFASMFLTGGVIFGSIWVLFSTITFFTTGTAEVGSAFTYGGNQLTQYPLNVYGPWLRRLLGFVVPLAFVNYFPSLYVLGKPDPLGFPRLLQFAAPLVAVSAAVVAGGAWRFAVRHYRSTGS